MQPCYWKQAKHHRRSKKKHVYHNSPKSDVFKLQTKTLKLLSFLPLSLHILISHIHIHILLFIRPHLPHPSWMNMHSSPLQIRVRYSSHLAACMLDRTSVAWVIGIQSWLLAGCAPGHKNHGNVTYTNVSLFVLFPGTDTYKQPHPDARTHPHIDMEPCKNSPATLIWV